MAAIRARDTKPELLLRHGLHARGLRYRLHRKDLPGRPDISLPRWQAVIFVHGCFWHGHDCPQFHLPATRPDFWRDKIGRNYARDCHAEEELLKQGWRVATVWECALKGKGRLPFGDVIDSLMSWLSSDLDRFCIQGQFGDGAATATY